LFASSKTKMRCAPCVALGAGVSPPALGQCYDFLSPFDSLPQDPPPLPPSPVNPHTSGFLASSSALLAPSSWSSSSCRQYLRTYISHTSRTNFPHNPPIFIHPLLLRNLLLQPQSFFTLFSPSPLSLFTPETVTPSINPTHILYSIPSLTLISHSLKFTFRCPTQKPPTLFIRTFPSHSPHCLLPKLTSSLSTHS